MMRKSPIHHRVRQHRRKDGRIFVHSYVRGKGGKVINVKRRILSSKDRRLDWKEVEFLEKADEKGRIRVYYSEPNDIDMAMSLASKGLLHKYDDMPMMFRDYRITREGQKAVEEYFSSGSRGE